MSYVPFLLNLKLLFGWGKGIAISDYLEWIYKKEIQEIFWVQNLLCNFRKALKFLWYIMTDEISWSSVA
jgi:hypothetical protein